MLNFAEQTGSGAVIVVWSFLTKWNESKYMKSVIQLKHMMETRPLSPIL